MYQSTNNEFHHNIIIKLFVHIMYYGNNIHRVNPADNLFFF